MVEDDPKRKNKSAWPAKRYLPPKHAITKGRPKRLKSSKEKAKKKDRLCRGCGKRGIVHDRRNCPGLDKSVENNNEPFNENEASSDDAALTQLVGVGKTSLVHLIVNDSAISRPPQTIGCTVAVKHTTYGSSGSSSNSIKGDAERDFFVELWDVSGHDRYKDCRSLFYSQINGVIFVHDISQKRTKTSLQKWAAEVAASGTFSAPLGSFGPGGLPVPYIVIGNKADIAAKEGTRGSSGNLVDVARQWVEKQGLLPSSEELPLTESFPGSGGLLAAAKEARFDKEAVIKFFRLLIRRRYFSDELPASNSWSPAPIQKSIHLSAENLRGDNSSDDDQNHKRLSLSSNVYKYNNTLPPLPAQRNLTPPPTLYPQQPMSTSENHNLPRFTMTGSLDFGNTKSKRTDINV